MDYKQIDEHSAVIRTLKENDIKIKPKGYSMYPEDMIIQEFLYYTEYAE